MTSPSQFNCVFCNESFDNKEVLQIHFRKHGDPKFDKEQKRRPQYEQLFNKEKKNAEMVKCDVCSESFPTISKAITHKHKLHPDHETKYFCPWCGKLFTLKHLYNKHLQSSHTDMEKDESVQIHCDCCDVDFNVVPAILYHNKFYHRQDTDIPSIGYSKKLKKIHQEVLTLHYCAFCGDEYDNKVNLSKHMEDEHSDENQTPVDIMRCPLCDAVFYHLDAYELHLTFHTKEDLYGEKNKMFEQLMEFSLESVPPVLEKVENLDSDDIVNTINSVGLENFLEIAMDESENEVTKKSKKHKKHKKSKKAAITLDEFLNMNQDVFGEGLDVEGVEEVPTRMVTKKLKLKKDKPSVVLQAMHETGPVTDIEKLKKQGIVVKMKPTETPTMNKEMPKKLTQIPKQFISNKSVVECKTSSEVLSKLLNQSNSQIKIVKKVTQDKKETDLENVTLTSVDQSQNRSNLPEETEAGSKNADKPFAPNKPENLNETHISNTDRDEQNNQTSIDSATKLNKESNNGLLDNLSDIEDKPEIHENFKTVSDGVDEHFKTVSDGEHDNEKESADICTNKCEINRSEFTNNSKNDSLDALKHLSQYITVKSLTSKENSENPTNQDCNLDKQETDLHTNGEENSLCEKESNKIKSINSLKSLNKNITVKPLSFSPTTSMNIKGSNDKCQESNNSNIIKNPNTVSKVVNTVTNKNIELKVPTPKQSPKFVQVDKNNSEKISNQSTSVNLLKRLSNITAKPVITEKKIDSQNYTNKSIPKVTKNETINNIIPNVKKKESDEIEIFNIDDSDSDGMDTNESITSRTTTSQTVVNDKSLLPSTNKVEKKINMQTPQTHPTKIIQQSKISTVKSQIINKQYQSESSDENDDNNCKRFKSQNISHFKHSTQKQVDSQTDLQMTLKNLSKHITIKSNNNSPNTLVNLNVENIPSQTYEDDESDHESVSDRVKITEANEDDFSDEDLNDSGKNGDPSSHNIVQFPEDSENSDGMNFDSGEEFSDLESHIPIKNPSQNVQKINLPNINKDITIKSITPKNKELQSATPKAIGVANKITGHSKKPLKIKKAENKNESQVSTNSNIIQASQTMNRSFNQSAMSKNHSSTINKEVTVKTYQTQTVIQEVTTTVTKTIKTVNQTVKQMQSTSQVAQQVRTQQVQSLKNNQNKNIQAVPVRQPLPMAGTKIRGMAPIRPQSPQTGGSIRYSNQIVNARPGVNKIRTASPRTPIINKAHPSTSTNQVRPASGPSKVAVIPAKRMSEDSIAHFSCFKKPKESLIPVSDIPDFNSDNNDSTTQYSSTSQSRSNFSSTLKTMKGNTVVTSTETKSECNSQELTKLNNLSELKVIKMSQSKQAMHVEEKKSEMNAAKRNTLEAIEKLQKQGLLVKKPRIEVNDECAPFEEDDPHFSDDEENN